MDMFNSNIYSNTFETPPSNFIPDMSPNAGENSFQPLPSIGGTDLDIPETPVYASLHINSQETGMTQIGTEDIYEGSSEGHSPGSESLKRSLTSPSNSKFDRWLTDADIKINEDPLRIGKGHFGSM